MYRRHNKRKIGMAVSCSASANLLILPKKSRTSSLYCPSLVPRKIIKVFENIECLVVTEVFRVNRFEFIFTRLIEISICIKKVTYFLSLYTYSIATTSTISQEYKMATNMPSSL